MLLKCTKTLFRILSRNENEQNIQTWNVSTFSIQTNLLIVTDMTLDLLNMHFRCKLKAKKFDSI
jgi:hypothetical protein